jgi:hypothetical protein
VFRRLSSAARLSKCSHIRRFPYLCIAEAPADQPIGFLAISMIAASEVALPTVPQSFPSDGAIRNRLYRTGNNNI